MNNWQTEMIKSLTYKGYTASISYSLADEVFFGQILDTKDLVNFEGTSENKLREAFQEAVDDYLMTCRSAGKYSDQPFFKQKVDKANHILKTTKLPNLHRQENKSD